MVLVGDVHVSPHRADYCERNPTQCDISRAVVLRQTAVERAFYTSLVSEDPTNRTIYMPTDHLLCDMSGARPGRECGGFVPGTNTLAFLDDNHLNSAGSLFMWPFVCDFFTRHGLLGE